MSSFAELSSRITLDAPEWLALLLLLIPMWWAAGRRTFEGRTARWAALARTALVVIIALAAAGLTLKMPAKRLGVVFVLDRSASLPGASV